MGGNLTKDLRELKEAFQKADTTFGSDLRSSVASMRSFGRSLGRVMAEGGFDISPSRLSELPPSDRDSIDCVEVELGEFVGKISFHGGGRESYRHFQRLAGGAYEAFRQATPRFVRPMLSELGLADHFQWVIFLHALASTEGLVSELHLRGLLTWRPHGETAHFIRAQPSPEMATAHYQAGFLRFGSLPVLDPGHRAQPIRGESEYGFTTWLTKGVFLASADAVSWLAKNPGRRRRSLPPQNNDADPLLRGDDGVGFSPDHKTFHVGQESYPLNSTQSEVVEILYTASLRGDRYLSQAYVLNEIGRPNTRLRDLFRKSVTWKELVTWEGCPQGSCRLILPPDD